MTAMGWWILGAVVLVALQFFALALVAHFDEDVPTPRPLSAPSNVTRTRREETP